MKTAPVAALLACLAVGCRSHTAPPTPEPRVGHVVIFWLKTPGDAAARRRVIEASHDFRKIPGVLSVDAGEMLPSPRPNVNKGYDVAVVIWMRDRLALEQYQVHSLHKTMLREIGPAVERTVVYDFTRAPY